jgi:RNA polymerase sigma-70 factor (ECF subfamily)
MDSDADEHDDDQLIEAARGGNGTAFEELAVKKHGPTAVRVVMRIVADKETAKDVFQETLLAAWEKLGSFESGRPFRPWFLKIAVHKALDSTRAATRRREAMLRTAVHRREATLTSDHESTESDIVQMCSSSLDERDRTIITLQVYDGLSYEEIAQILDCPIGTVMSRRHRAAKKLRERLERLGLTGVKGDRP